MSTTLFTHSIFLLRPVHYICRYLMNEMRQRRIFRKLYLHHKQSFYQSRSSFECSTQLDLFTPLNFTFRFRALGRGPCHSPAPSFVKYIVLKVGSDRSVRLGTGQVSNPLNPKNWLVSELVRTGPKSVVRDGLFFLNNYFKFIKNIFSQIKVHW